MTSDPHDLEHADVREHLYREVIPPSTSLGAESECATGVILSVPCAAGMCMQYLGR
jgi:hypothetical protein